MLLFAKERFSASVLEPTLNFRPSRPPCAHISRIVCCDSPVRRPRFSSMLPSFTSSTPLVSTWPTLRRRRCPRGAEGPLASFFEEDEQQPPIPGFGGRGPAPG